MPAPSPDTPRIALWPHETRDAEAVVRGWLAEVNQMKAAEILLSRDDRGRPRLQGALADCDVNWSHGGGWLLAGFGRDVDLGVDIEALRARPNALKLAARFFARQEAAWLAALPPQDIDTAFVRLWCAKEAVLKAHGHGLSFGLDRLRFEEAEDGLRLAACDPALGETGAWRLRQWSPQPGLHAAMAWRARR